MQGFWKRAVLETATAAILCTVFCLLAVSLFAVFVRAFAPSDTTVTVVNQIIHCLGVFVFSLICVRSERALFKGAAAGLLSTVLTMLLFGAIGGFHITVIFLAELLLGIVFGALGALCGKKLRKE